MSNILSQISWKGPFDSCDQPRKFCFKLDSNHRFFRPCDVQILWMTLKNNRAPLLYYIKLCASCQTHWWIQTGVTVQKRSIWLKISHICPLWPWNLTDDLQKKGTSSMLLQYLSIIPIWVKINNFFSPVTFKFDGWPWKTIGHIFYATSNFMHHFTAIYEFKLEIQSGNAHRVSSHEPSQNSLTFPWHFPDHFVVFPDHETYYRHFITALTLILQAIWQITHQK